MTSTIEKLTVDEAVAEWLDGQLRSHGAHWTGGPGGLHIYESAELPDNRILVVNGTWTHDLDPVIVPGHDDGLRCPEYADEVARRVGKAKRFLARCEDYATLPSEKEALDAWRSGRARFRQSNPGDDPIERVELVDIRAGACRGPRGVALRRRGAFVVITRYDEGDGALGTNGQVFSTYAEATAEFRRVTAPDYPRPEYATGDVYDVHADHDCDFNLCHEGPLMGQFYDF